MAKYTVKINKIPKMVENVGGLGGRKVEVGAFEGDHAWLAGIHEYGCNIPVTDRMRNYLHSQGLHLKKSTTIIKIPERSFLRSGHDEKADKILKQAERAIGQVAIGKMSVDTLLDLYGEQFATAIKTYMRDLDSPANHPYTVEQKGTDNPLIQTGNLIESISWKKR